MTPARGLPHDAVERDIPMEELEPVDTRTPEERELDQKRAELAELESELIERELDLSTLEQELAAFRADYLRIVGRRYATLDGIKARIAAVRASQRPNEPFVQDEARRARETADDTAKQAGNVAPRGEPLPPFEPPDALKALYRTAARQMHPDLAATDAERTRRHEWMAKVNDAYKLRNENALKSLLETWAESPESVEGTGIASELVRVIRQIAQVRRRIKAIEKMVDEIEAAELYALYTQYDTALDDGRDLLDEMANRLSMEIVLASRELAGLEAEPR